VPARAVQSVTQLDEWLSALVETGGQSILLIAGDRKVAAGPFENTLDLLASGRLAEHGIRRIGVAGHPEGSPFATPAELDRALAIKREYAAQNAVDLWIVTQFVFASRQTVEWLEHVRRMAPLLPIYIGLPGPARLSTLVAYAAQCGVSVSARLLRRRPGAARLLGRWTPDGLVKDLALHAARSPGSAMDGIHVYPFGGVTSATEWLGSLRASGDESTTGVEAAGSGASHELPS
jgi:methylenetetrahydrofolate reductase (NADPH)